MENQIQKFKKENNNNQLANYKNFKELTKWYLKKISKSVQKVDVVY